MHVGAEKVRSATLGMITRNKRAVAGYTVARRAARRKGRALGKQQS